MQSTRPGTHHRLLSGRDGRQNIACPGKGDVALLKKSTINAKDDRSRARAVHTHGCELRAAVCERTRISIARRASSPERPAMHCSTHL